MYNLSTHPVITHICQQAPYQTRGSLLGHVTVAWNSPRAACCG